MEFFAHIRDDGRQQTILEHLNGTADLAEAFAAEFDEAAQGRLIGLAHDIGKYSTDFQKRLFGAPIHVDHSTAGAFACWQQRQGYAAFAVAGHHSGLPDGGSRTGSNGSLQSRIQKAAKGEIPCCDAWKTEVTLPDPPCHDFSDPLDAVFFTRMLYSCLVDADFLDTEAFMEGTARKSPAADISLLYRRLQQYISPWFPPESPLNVQRCEALTRCIREGERNEPGLFTLTVPTGGGKTVASLAFALSHAKRNNMKRIVYVVPYTSIIEQTADVFREILGEENVLEHHSNVIFDISQEASPETVRLAKATENWDMPVIVTTAVQFFESLFSNRSSKCRKLHNLSNCVIVFDEAQMIPISCLQPCVYSIAELVKHFKSTAVLCTATQPSLERIFQIYLPGVSPKELCPKEDFHWDAFKRVTFRRSGQQTWEQIAVKMNMLPQALCIVNSRKNAGTLYELLNKDGSFHLSTLMCPTHRRRILEEIRRRLKNGLPCRVVSTSLIEAGVDVDFPAVFREEAGLDSILQAAGRCNREGTRPKESSIVTIFKSEAPVPPLFGKCTDIGRRVLEKHDCPDAPEAIREYFNELMALSGTDAQDKYKIIQLIKNAFFPFQSIAERFHMIDSAAKTIIVPMDNQARDAVDKYLAGKINRALMQKLGQYSVEVFPGHYRELNTVGAITVVGENMAVLDDLSLYSEQIGLSLKADSGKALFI